jgi:uncharacterized repeat protein (TIGR03803 family)
MIDCSRRRAAHLSLTTSCAAIVGLIITGWASESSAGPEHVLHAFAPDGADAGADAPLIADASGNMYGTTGAGGEYEGGTVFELSPKVGGGWSFKTILSLDGLDGAGPGSLTFDSQGNLYGAAGSDGVNGNGAIFELAPDKKGGWKLIKSMLLDGSYGMTPSAIAVDAAGNIFGTAYSGGSDQYGTVFELTPVEGGWTAKTLYNFQGNADGENPAGGIVLDAKDNIYGTTSYGGPNEQGMVFELRNSKSGWQKRVIYAFTGGQDGQGPNGNLIFFRGDIYGTATRFSRSGYGTVFKLSRPKNDRGGAQPWSEITLFQFVDGPDGGFPLGVALDAHGKIYGVTGAGGDQSCSCGVVYSLTPTQSGPWTEDVLYNFTGDYDGYDPEYSLLIGDDKKLYGVTTGGGAEPGVNGRGVVFSVKK